MFDEQLRVMLLTVLSEWRRLCSAGSEYCLAVANSLRDPVFGCPADRWRPYVLVDPGGRVAVGAGEKTSASPPFLTPQTQFGDEPRAVGEPDWDTCH